VGVLEDSMSDAMQTMLSAGMSEEISYAPNGGAAVTISAVVFRQAPSRDRIEQASIGKTETVIYVSRVDVPVVTEKVDVVRLVADVHDAAAKSYRVGQIVSQDAGGYTLSLLG
jgi:hypothetical protein